MTPPKPIHPKLARKRNKQLLTKLVSAGLFAFSVLTRGPTLLRLLLRSRLEPAGAAEAHAPDVYSLGVMLLLMDWIGHAGHVGTTFRHPPSGAGDDGKWSREEEVGSSSSILLTTNAVAWLSLSVLLAAMAPYAHRDALFWLAVVFQIAAGFVMPASVAIWRSRSRLTRFARRGRASGVPRRARRVSRPRRMEGAAGDAGDGGVVAGEVAADEVALGKVASGGAAHRDAAAGNVAAREIAAPEPALVRFAAPRDVA
ncbi:hypothetical protein PpBr36_00903 [Pyricularia pennisetigena]|uniref:hypothetical protein n=1 Tax=Pyricularia pennisetigena TaxID=1578925 RepID=UPI0011508B0D|nr:hypothetical protein PpBr36_00903 [Pyricularia pennisetigena]TLS29213.1 hypothetical protein PpBr36_00903 [Pyricularia pennisetigena]